MQNKITVERVVALLSNVPLFESLSDEYKTLLAGRLGFVRFNPGDVIVQDGEQGDRMYIIVGGKVGVYQVDALLGLEVELARLYPGQFFGEMSLLTGAPRSAMCRALEHTEAMVLHQQVLFALMQRAPELSITMCRVLAERLSESDLRRGQPRVEAHQLKYDAEIYQMIPRRLRETHRLIPLSVKQNTLTVATPDPTNQVALDDVRRVLRGVKVRPVFVQPDHYERFVADHAQNEGAQDEQATTELDVIPGTAEDALAAMLKQRQRRKARQALQQGPVTIATVDTSSADLNYIQSQSDDEKLKSGDPVKAFNDIVIRALKAGASDIHIEPTPYSVVVRYRIEGQLQVDPNPMPVAMGRAIMSRLKILAKLDIAERRTSQDGRISLVLDGRPYDLRVNTMPTIDGEKAVLRVLDTISGLKPLNELVLIEPVCNLIRRLANQPYGMLIVCGPTGSGKTTTLYSALHERAGDQTNITTVEDPVEFNIPSFNQIQVNPQVGLTFPAVLRGILRQNPDIILVGETRDVETARIALEAGLVGHLVMTSFHANTAPGALVRFMEMGMDPYSLGYAVNGILCQRLVRRLCPVCATEEPQSPSVIGALVEAGILPKGTTEGSFMTPQGCPACNGTGFNGRIATFELLTMNESIRAQLLARAPLEDITRAASGTDHVSMARYGASLLTRGLTTPQEILRTHQTSART